MTHRDRNPHTIWRFCRALLAGLAVAAPGLPTAHAETGYRYVDVDTGNDISAVAVNNSGVVAYKVGLQSSQRIYKWSNGVRALVADLSGPFSSFGPDIEINDSGLVVFQAGLDAGGFGIFTTDGGTLTPIVTTATSSPSGGLFQGFGNPSINSSGVIAFHGRANGVQGIFTISGGIITKIIDESSPLNTFGTETPINDAGAVGFTAFFDDRQFVEGAFTSSGGGSFTKIFDGNSTLIGVDVSSLNNAGRLAFLARRDVETGPIGIYSGVGGQLQTVVEYNERSGLRDDPAINDAGVIVYTYVGATGSHPLGIFTSPNIEDRVIMNGDPLFGSTAETTFEVPNKSFAHSLNDKGQVAFAYHLANGRTGVALATPIPEPSALALSAAGLAALAFARRRRAII